MPRFLTEHFTLEELISSQVAARKNIDNSPPTAVSKNLKLLAALLEDIRTLLGNHPVVVSSGYRCPALNQEVGGALNSYHMDGLAADFTVPSYGTPLQTARAIASSGIVYDQLIHEFGTWVHIGLPRAGADPRHENLSIFSGSGSINGLVGKPR